MAGVIDVAAYALGNLARKQQHLGEEHDLASSSAHANRQRRASACLCVQEVKTRLAYVTRRKLHKAKREQQKKLKALEERRQVCCLIVHGTALQLKSDCAFVRHYAGVLLLLYSLIVVATSMTVNMHLLHLHVCSPASSRLVSSAVSSSQGAFVEYVSLKVAQVFLVLRAVSCPGAKAVKKHFEA